MSIYKEVAVENISDLVVDLEAKGAKKRELTDKLKSLKEQTENEISEITEALEVGRGLLAEAIHQSKLPSAGAFMLADGRVMRYKISQPSKKDDANFKPQLLACERLEVFKLGEGGGNE